MKYSEVVGNFLRYLETVDRSDQTIKGYGKELRYFGDFLMEKYGYEKEFQDIDLEDMEEYMYLIKLKGKMSATRSRVIYILRSFYNYAYKRELCPKQLPIYLEPVQVKHKERFFLNNEQMQELFTHIHHPIVKVAVQTLYYTGMRVSELTELRMHHLDMDNRLIFVENGKGNKDRKIPVSNKLYLILENYLKNIRPNIDSNRLFCTARSGGLTSQYINLILKEAQKPLQLDRRVTPHILRHSFASMMIKANVPLPYLQKLLGHADLRVTSIYIHQDIDELRHAMEQI